jgi:hypothetical protein
MTSGKNTPFALLVLTVLVVALLATACAGQATTSSSNAATTAGTVATTQNLTTNQPGTTAPSAQPRLAAAKIADSQQRVLFAGGGLTADFEYQLTSDAATMAYLEIAEKGTAEEHGRVLARTEKASATTGATLLWDGTGLDDKVVAEGEYLAYVVTEDAAGNQVASRPVAVAVYQPIGVDGVVKDGSGNPVSGAKVDVAGTALSVTTDADGAFHLASCPMGFRTFEASKTGAGSGSVWVKLNHSTGTVTVVLGQTTGKTARTEQVASAATATYVAMSPGSSVTISGHLYYRDEQDVAQPMRGVRVVLQDDATTFWDNLFTCTSTDTGYFSFTYDYDDVWDSWNEPDVRVVAYAEDRDTDICGVYDGYWSTDPYEFVATRTWNDNTSDRTNLDCYKTGNDRVAFFIYDCARRAHDRWQELTGYDRDWIWVDYPADIDKKKSGEFEIDVAYTCINIRQGDSEWSPATTYHEYGHSVHYALSDLGKDCNAYAAYSDSGFVFYERGEGKWYTEKDNTYGIDEEGGAWLALKEGFAEFFAAVISNWDRGAIGETATYERNADVGPRTYKVSPWSQVTLLVKDQDDARIAHSVARALWDIYDGTETPLCCNWDYERSFEYTGHSLFALVPPYPLARPMGPLGNTDDDMLSNTGTAPFGNTLAKLVTVLRYDYPADVHELYEALIERYSAAQLDRTALQAAFYSQGILKDHPVEWAPQVSDTAITPAPSNGAYRGTLRVYAQVDDTDGSRDLDRASVRLEWGVADTRPGVKTVYWSPLGCTYTRLHYGPPGKSGDNWYAIDWDTRVPSPCTIAFKDDSPFGYATNGARDGTAIAGRKEGVRLRVIANDRFTDSAPVELAPITVDNTPGVFGDQVTADAPSDCIAWAGMDSITHLPYTYELFFTPSVLQAGIIAEYTLGYAAPTECRAPIMRLELTDDGRVLFSVNMSNGSGPGGGTWCYPYDPQDPTRLEVGHRYHIAADNGPWGLRLYIDGKLEAAAPYFDYPQPDWSDGTLYGGWFSIGAYDTLSPAESTALGQYDEVRVSKVQRYTGDADHPFTPPSAPFTMDADTVLLDHLDGSTAGENNGMTFGP